MPMSEPSGTADDLESKLIGVQRRDPEKLKESLLPWLRGKIGDAEEITLPLPVAPKAGGSSEVFFIDPIIRKKHEVRQEHLVVRIEAAGHRIYEFPSIERQYRTMAALGKIGAVPVPAMYWMEDDKGILGESFLVMERVSGSVPYDFYHSKGLLFDALPRAREEMWLSALQAIAAIHSADVRSFEFLGRPELGPTGLQQEMAVWDSYSRWIGLPLKPVQERAHRWLHDRLPTQMPPGLTWGDARVPNMIFRDNACRAVLDWETVSLSGAENDLGWMLFYDWFASDGHGIPRLDGIPGRDATVEIWTELTNRKPVNLSWCEVFATWRFSLIRDHALHLAGIDRMPGLPSPDPVHLRLEELIKSL